MRKALIAGSSGLVGKFLLELLLASEAYEEVYVLVRRRTSLNHAKLREILFNFDEAEYTLPAVNDVFCVLGTTIKKAGSKESFQKVDLEYPWRIARAASENGADSFAVVTAMGSDPRSFFFYNRVKGQLEECLRSLPFRALGIFRPSLLLGARKEKRLGESIGQRIMEVLEPVIPLRYRAIEGERVAMSMVNWAVNCPAGVHVITSDEMNKP